MESPPPVQPSPDSLPPPPPRKHRLSLEPEEEASKRHKHHRPEDPASDKHRSSGDKHRHRDDREDKPSKHKHRHHKHKHRRKHRREHADGGADDIGSDKDEAALGDPGIGRVDDANEGVELGFETQGVESSDMKPNLMENCEDSRQNCENMEFDAVLVDSFKSNTLEREDACAICSEADRVTILPAGEPDSREGEGSGISVKIGAEAADRDPGLYKGEEALEGKNEDCSIPLSDNFLDGRMLEDDKMPLKPGEVIEGGKLHEERDDRKTTEYMDEEGPSAILHEQINGCIIESALDDEKEEGEILDEEETTRKIAESDIESGEIKTGEGFGREDAGMDEISSGGLLPTLPSSQMPNTKLDGCKMEHGTFTLKEQHGKAVHNGAPVVESMLGLAEYDSDQVSDDSRIEGGMTAESESYIVRTTSEVEVGTAKGRGEVDQVYKESKLGSLEADLNTRAEINLESDDLKIRSNDDDHDSPSKQLSKQGRDVLAKPIYSDSQSHSQDDSGTIEYTRQSRSREGEHDARRRSESHERENLSKRSGTVDLIRRSRSRETEHDPRFWRESHERAHQRKRATSKEPCYSRYQRDSRERNERGRRSKSRDAVHESRYDKDASERRGKRSKSRESAYDSKYAKDSSEKVERHRRSTSRGAVQEFKYTKDSSERIEWASRRSRSREGAQEFPQSKDVRDRGDRDRRSRSREAAQEFRHARDAQVRSDRDRRSRSRAAVHDSRHTDIWERSERSRRSRSREAALESRHTKHNHDRTERGRRSRSRDVQHRVSGQDRVRRSKSRESFRDRRDNLDRRRRSMSRESLRDRRDNLDRRRRSRSRESLRDQRASDHSMYRYGRHFEGTAGRSQRNERIEGHAHSSHSLRSRRLERSSDGVSYHGITRDKKADQSSKGMDEGLREEENQEEYQERVTLQLAAQEDDDVERIKEESRRRRQAILEKYKQQKQQEQVKDGQAGAEAHDRKDEFDESMSAIESTMDSKAPQSLQDGVSTSVTATNPQISSDAFTLGKGLLQNGLPLPSRLTGTGGLGEGTPKSEKSNEMVCDYIFGESPAGGRKLAKGDGLALETSGLTDNWDDAEGYYCYRIGEVLDGRYEVAASHGRGVFSSVVRARDLKASRGDPEEVAIKIIRNNELMFKSGQQEHVILKKLVGADPENRQHCVRFLTSFEYRNHLCLVFESLHMNLREILKKFGRNIGINLNAVRAYAKQLFIALKHLRNCGVLHCDIKPDNMLVNEAKNVLKLCDFGSAMFAGENEITPYLVSRFYRAPEIILGLPYDHALDIWSVGCCLYEFYTGKVLFPGPTNNDMLRLQMELKGPFPKKMLKKAGFALKHFDQDYNFCAVEEDPVTKTTIKRVLVNVKPKDIGSLITGLGTADEDAKMLGNFKDLLEKIFMLDPDKRLTVSQALNHPFITGK